MELLKSIRDAGWLWVCIASGGFSVIAAAIGKAYGWADSTVYAYTVYGSLLLCAITLAWKVRQLASQLRPCLSVVCDTDSNPLCKDTFEIVPLPKEARPFTRPWCTYYRMVISANPPNTAKGCKVTILSIRQNGNELLQPDKMEVNFTHSDGNEKFCKSVANGTPEMADILRIEETHNLIFPDRGTSSVHICGRIVSRNFEAKRTFQEHGVYELTVAISSETGTARTVELAFTWGGSEENSSLKRVK